MRNQTKPIGIGLTVFTLVFLAIMFFSGLGFKQKAQESIPSPTPIEATSSATPVMKSATPMQRVASPTPQKSETVINVTNQNTGETTQNSSEPTPKESEPTPTPSSSPELIELELLDGLKIKI